MELLHFVVTYMSCFVAYSLDIYLPSAGGLAYSNSHLHYHSIRLLHCMLSEQPLKTTWKMQWAENRVASVLIGICYLDQANSILLGFLEDINNGMTVFTIYF